MSEKQALPSIAEVAQNVVAKMSSPDESQAVAETAATTTPVEGAPVEGVTDGGEGEGEGEAAQAAVETPAPEKKEDKYSRQFATLSRRDREMKQRENALKSREAEVDSKIAEMQKQIEQYKNVQQQLANLKKMPVKTLKELGVSYSDVAQDAMGQYKEPEPDPLDAKLQPLVERLTKAEQAAKELEALKAELHQNNMAQAEEAVRTNFVDTIESGGDKYELCKNMGDEAIELSRYILQSYYDTHKKLLTYEEVLDITEKHYEEKVLGRLLASKKASTLAERNKPAPTTTAKVPPKKSGSATLTQAQRGHIDNVNIDNLPKDQALDALVKKHFSK